MSDGDYITVWQRSDSQDSEEQFPYSACVRLGGRILAIHTDWARNPLHMANKVRREWHQGRLGRDPEEYPSP